MFTVLTTPLAWYPSSTRKSMAIFCVAPDWDIDVTSGHGWREVFRIMIEGGSPDLEHYQAWRHGPSPWR